MFKLLIRNKNSTLKKVVPERVEGDDSISNMKILTMNI